MIFGEDDSKNMGNRPNHPPGQPGGQPQQIQLDLRELETIYSNFFGLGGAPEEVVIYFGASLPLPNVPQPVIKLSHRVVMLPRSAKQLMLALQQMVKAHEERFGPIELPPQRRPDTKP